VLLFVEVGGENKFLCSRFHFVSNNKTDISKKKMPPKKSTGAGQYDVHNAEDWTLLFNEVSEDLGALKEKLVDRNKKIKSGSSMTPQQSANFRQTISSIDRDVRDLRDALKSLKKQVYVLQLSSGVPLLVLQNNSDFYIYV